MGQELLHAQGSVYEGVPGWSSEEGGRLGRQEQSSSQKPEAGAPNWYRGSRGSGWSPDSTSWESEREEDALAGLHVEGQEVRPLMILTFYCLLLKHSTVKLG